MVLLAGGTGGAKLARGMLDEVGEDLVVIANTGDDVEMYGGHVSPDPDLVTFWLADRIDARGWGLREGQLVVDATVPLAAAVSGRATRMLGVWQGSAAQQAAEMVPDGVGVVSALHTVSAAALRDPAAALEEDVLVCGDRKADKARAAGLIERIPGLRCVDCGRLENARTTESLTALLIGVNARYKTHAGIRITALPDSLWDRPS